MEQPPLSSVAPPARTSKLAVSSLVLGIIGLFCLPLLGGIPAVILGHKARGRIRQSGGTEGGAGLALAGLIMGYLSIVVAVVGLLVAIPLVIQAKKTGETLRCVANLRMIDFAKEQWATENEKQPTDVPKAEDLNPLMEKPLDSLKCPLNGTYTINAVGQKPTCSVPEHKLN